MTVSNYKNIMQSPYTIFRLFWLSNIGQRKCMRDKKLFILTNTFYSVAPLNQKTFRFNKWFSSYLSNWRQFVCVDNILSVELTIPCCSSRFSPRSFALSYCPCMLFPQTNLNKELAEVYKWLCVNKFSLNIEKSYFVIFHPRQRKIDY
jgi:hypothetical protein